MKEKIEKKLELAAIYAGDGGLSTALKLCEEAIKMLHKEIARREKMVQRAMGCPKN